MIRLANSIRIFSTFSYSARQYFATKPPKQTGIIKVSIKKINEALNGQLIYKTTKTKQFLIMSGLMSLGLAFSVYVFQKQSTFINLVPLIITITAAALYQKRIFNTVRQIIVQKSGQRINVIKYGLFGSEIFAQTVNVPIHIMAGVARKPINKGIAIRGGGRFGIKSFSYYFHEAGVLDKFVFNSVISGKQIQYTDLI